MKWAANLYTTADTAQRARKIMRRADRGKKLKKVFFISLSSNPDDLFDIFSAAQLQNKAYVWRDPFIVGIAEGRTEAFELVREMVDDIYRETGGFDVDTYFACTKRGS